MCLSNVYVIEENEQRRLLCKNVAEVSTKGKSLRFIDVMGIPTDFEGEILKIDLVDNIIDVKA